MVRNAVLSLWAEPRAPDPPVRVWRDWVLVGALAPTAVLEGVLRDDVVWRPVALVLGLGLVFSLLWRRTRPLAAVVAAFGTVIVADVAALLVGADGSVGLDTKVYVLLLLYALCRWGSGREAVIGLAVILVTGALGTAVDFTGVVDALVGGVFLLFPAVLGAAVRYRATGRIREMDQVKLRERQQLARELHDTVAHHVSAIAIRAQAGRVVAASDPGAAVAALEVIEADASRALTEMRVMVGALRAGEEPDLAPQRGVGDIERLARAAGDSPPVDVELNTVRVTGDDDCVRLTVAGGCDTSPTGRSPSGYGLVGVTERATFLGGTLEAGPSLDRGWTVDAVLPRTGSAR